LFLSLSAFETWQLSLIVHPPEGARMARGGRLLVTLALVGLAVTAGLVVGFRTLDSYLDPFDDRPFDPAAWATASDRVEDRGPMARDAIRHLPAGMPKERVRELLGEGRPPWRDPHRPVDAYGVQLDHPETWVYPLGCWSGLGPYGFDDAFLYVHFDPDGRVVAAEVNGG
jgi:hypothetical protein